MSLFGSNQHPIEPPTPTEAGELIGVIPGQWFTIEDVIENTWVAIPTGETVNGTVTLSSDGYVLSNTE